MRILVLGATGPSGILTVRQILAKYPDTTIIIYVRSPQKVPDDIRGHPLVTILKGELSDIASAFDKDIGHVDVVISALGPPLGRRHSPTLPISTAYQSLVVAMNKHGCSRLIALSTISATDPRDKFSLIPWSLVQLIKIFQPNAYKEITTLSEFIRKQTDVPDWTLVRVPALTNGVDEDNVAGYVGDGHVGSTLTRAALAAFFVEQIENTQWVRKAPAISSTKLHNIFG